MKNHLPLISCICIGLILGIAIIFLLENQGLAAQGDVENALGVSIGVPENLGHWQISPADGSRDVSVYPQLMISGEKPVTEVSGYLQSEDGTLIGGEWEVSEGLARFSPYQVLENEHTYHFTGYVNGDAVISSFTVTAVSLPNMWIEVALGMEQKVYVWENGQIIQAFPCSGGLPESPTVIGIFKLQDRGNAFYSARFCEGARYWIRIQDQYLFHSVPRDEEQNILLSELEKIGQAASHGCVRLYDEDAKWLYERIPEGTTVVIHPAMPDLFTKNLLES